MPTPEAHGWPAWRNALVLMRIPFSRFLMPVFWFGAAFAQWPYTAGWGQLAALFAIIHLLLYPASNGYNSYHDRDEGPVGGLAAPPLPNAQLRWLVWAFDVLAVGLGCLVGLPFAAMLLAYTLASKAYSWPGIRLKASPYWSTVFVVVFQGAFTMLMVQVGLRMPLSKMLGVENLLAAAVSSLLILGSYPLTQVYQHEEDAARGDLTISRLLGVRGTFLLCIAAFLVANGLLAALAWWNAARQAGVWNWPWMLGYLAFTSPIAIRFLGWMQATARNGWATGHHQTMRFNAVASWCVSGFFMLICAIEWYLQR